MKINSIINRYIFAEMIPPFGISLVFLSFVFLMSQILEITNLVVNYRVSIISVLLLLVYSMPEFLGFTIPMSVMLAVLLTFLRMSSDNEIIALKAGGISISRLLPPVLVFALIGCLLTGLMTICGSSWGKLAFKRKAVEIAISNVDIGLKERTFNDSFQGVMLYVNKIDMKDKSLKDVFINDERSAKSVSTVVAPLGKLFSEAGKAAFTLRLYNGSINQVDLEHKSVNSIHFDTYDVHLDVEQDITASKDEDKDIDEMSMEELHHLLEKTPPQHKANVSARIDLHRRVSIPFACFTLGMLAVALGLQSTSAKRSSGPGLGIVFFLFYYLLLTAGTSFSKMGYCPPFIGMWLPNMVFGTIGIYLFIRTSKERYIKLDVFIHPIRSLISRFFG